MKRHNGFNTHDSDSFTSSAAGPSYQFRKFEFDSSFNFSIFDSKPIKQQFRTNKTGRLYVLIMSCTSPVAVAGTPPTHKKWKEIISAKWVLKTVTGANIEFEDIFQIPLFKENIPVFSG